MKSFECYFGAYHEYKKLSEKTEDVYIEANGQLTHKEGKLKDILVCIRCEKVLNP